MAPEVRPQVKWRKILYEDQGVPDNYVDESFLDDLKKNLYIRTYNFWSVVLESGVVTQQISSVCLFVASFIYMDNDRLSPQLLFAISSCLTVGGYIINNIIENGKEHEASTRTRWDDVKTAIIFLVASSGLSPVLMTLTDTISTDTIYAMTVFMLLASLLFHDYGANAAMVSQSLSLNASIFASVCLASRLSTTWHAFTTVTLAIEVFALWPVLRRKLKAHVKHSQPVMTVVLGIAAATVIHSISTVAAVIFSSLHLFITFICPAWLIRLQPYKNNIYGPWDEAVIQE